MPQTTQNCCRVFTSVVRNASWSLLVADLGLLTFRFILFFCPALYGSKLSFSDL